MIWYVAYYSSWKNWILESVGSNIKNRIGQENVAPPLVKAKRAIVLPI